MEVPQVGNLFNGYTTCTTLCAMNNDGKLRFSRTELGPLDVRVCVPEDWIGMASATIKEWPPEANTPDRIYELSFDVEDALVGIAPSVPCLPLTVWGAVVSVLVEQRVRARALELVNAHAVVPLPRSKR